MPHPTQYRSFRRADTNNSYIFVQHSDFVLLVCYVICNVQQNISLVIF